MSGFKKIGKGLEDISYLFLSSSEDETLSKNTFSQKEKKKVSILEVPIKSVCLIGNNSPFLDAFLVINLSLALARLGMRIAVVDMELELPCLNFFQSNEDHKDSVNSLDDMIKEGPLGVKLISLNPVTSEKFLNKGTDSAAFQKLKKIEEEVDLVLINVMQKNFFSMKTLLKDMVREFLVMAVPDKRRMLESYRIMKGIFQNNPLSKIGVVVTDVDHMYEIDIVYNKLAQTVTKFLDKELYKCGFLFKIRQELDYKTSIASFYDADLTACISNIAQIIVLRLNVDEGTLNKGTFFKTMVEDFKTEETKAGS